ncbi:MAG: sulfotransferase [Nitrospirota bacterium]
MSRFVQKAKIFVPPVMRQEIRKYLDEMKVWIAYNTGVLPDFLIIGAQKCGTTSLYNYLIQHPCIYPASVKEVGFFDRYYEKSLKWYRAQFPSAFSKYYLKFIGKQRFITGEASTGYVLNPHALERIFKITPRAKLILLLRNPVDRAYSHYQHTLRIGMEDLSFDAAIEKEDERIGDAWEKMKSDENYYNFDIALYAYLRTGTYIDQVELLFKLFAKEQILIVKAEEFNSHPADIFRGVLDFLNMPPYERELSVKHNAGNYPPMDPAIRQKLGNYFKPYNHALYHFLGRNFNWDA